MPRLIRYENPAAEGLAAFGAGMARGAAADRVYTRDRADDSAMLQQRDNNALVADQLQHVYSVDRDRQRTDLDRQYQQEDDRALEREFAARGIKDDDGNSIVVQNGKAMNPPVTAAERIRREAEDGRMQRADTANRLNIARLKQQILRDAQTDKRGWGGIIQRGTAAFSRIAQDQAELAALQDWRKKQDENADAKLALDREGLAQKEAYTAMLREKMLRGTFDAGRELDRIQRLYDDQDRAGKKRLLPMLQATQQAYEESLTAEMQRRSGPPGSPGAAPQAPADTARDRQVPAGAGGGPPPYMGGTPAGLLAGPIMNAFGGEGQAAAVDTSDITEDEAMAAIQALGANASDEMLAEWVRKHRGQ